MSTWQVDLTLGDPGPDQWAASIPLDDTVDPTSDVQNLDGLTFGWEISDEKWPAQRDPGTATLSLLVDDIAHLPALDPGTPLTIDIQYGSPGNRHSYYLPCQFAGRVTDLDATPDPQRGGMVVTLTAADYLADLANIYIGDEPWPLESGDERLARIAAAAGIDLETSFHSVYVDFHARDVDHQRLSDVLEDHLWQITGYPTAYARAAVEPFLVDGQVQYKVITMNARSGDYSLPNHYPAILTADGHLTMNEGYPWSAIDAAHVDLSTTWRKDKLTAINRVLIPGEYSVYVGGDPPYEHGVAKAVNHAQVAKNGPQTQSMDSTLADFLQADDVAVCYLGDPNEGTVRWGIEGFSVHYDLVDTGIFHDGDLMGFFPITLATGYPGHPSAWVTTHPYGRVLAIYGIPTAQNPTGKPWVAGQLTSARVTVTGGHLKIDATLRPSVLAAGFNDFLRWVDVDATLTWANFDPAISWYDLRLARSPDA